MAAPVAEFPEPTTQRTRSGLSVTGDCCRLTRALSSDHFNLAGVPIPCVRVHDGERAGEFDVVTLLGPGLVVNALHLDTASRQFGRFGHLLGVAAGVELASRADPRPASDVAAFLASGLKLVAAAAGLFGAERSRSSSSCARFQSINRCCVSATRESNPRSRRPVRSAGRGERRFLGRLKIASTKSDSSNSEAMLQS